MRCAEATADKTRWIACSWADHGTYGMVLSLGRNAYEVEVLTRQARGLVVTRG
jgi:hypothetical protein